MHGDVMLDAEHEPRWDVVSGLIRLSRKVQNKSRINEGSMKLDEPLLTMFEYLKLLYFPRELLVCGSFRRKVGKDECNTWLPVAKDDCDKLVG